MNKLIAGPDSIEFGWLVATWIPYVRYRAKKYQQIIIVCNKANKYLYEDFATDFIFYEKEGNPDRWLLDGKHLHIPNKILTQYKNATVKSPNEKYCMSNKKEYIKYGKITPYCKFDLVIHARAINRYKSAHRNWPIEKYAEVVNNLKDKNICCIGTINGASHIQGTVDLRGIELYSLCNVLRNSTCCLGSSSGPMHLASLCGCPHIVITGNEKRKVLGYKTNEDRYETLWNPFNTKCIVLDKHKWNPPVQTVLEAINGLFRPF